MLLIVYAIEWSIWGNWAPGYHLVNTLIHILNAILLFLLLTRISKNFFFRFFPSLIFLIHPLQTEAVTYVSGLGDSLSFFYILLGIMLYMRWLENSKEKRGIFFYFGTLFLFIVTLLTKERGIIFPAYLLLIELWYWYKEKTYFKNFLKKLSLSLLPFILIACIFLLLRGTILNFQNTFNIYNAETPYTTNILVRTDTFLKILPSYVGLYFFPKTLFMERSETISYAQTIFDPSVLIGICITLAFIFLSLFTIERNPKYTFGTLFLFVSFLPASGIIIPVAGIMYEHYMYTPIIGISIILGALFANFSEKFKNKKYLVIILFTIIVWGIFLSVRTISRNTEWRDPITLYKQTLLHAPTSLRVWNNLGIAYSDKHEQAIDAYTHAIQLDPQNPIPYHNLGNSYEALGDLKTARKNWQIAVSLNPDFIPPQLKLEKYK
ncbi:MAG: tetratricopeptide repeat protein [Candidatus Paceibacterota bacterium]|jgi:tetratricopeptide (TPR) repeat protein